MTLSGQNGLLLLDKKPGFTSFDSLAEVKKAFSTRKVGHTGTLDKFASGLLLVLVGKGVKLVPLFDKCKKEYMGTVFFGEERDTLDPEGEVIARGEVPSLKEIEAVLDSFRGPILQSPPAYSAIHVKGRRAHELVRAGKEVEMAKRPVTVFQLEILSWDAPSAKIRALVSSGTYIRSLARDIALAAGSRAYLSALKRTKVGPFSLEDAFPGYGGAITEALRPLDTSLFYSLSVPCFFIDDKAADGFIHGKPLEDILQSKMSDIRQSKMSDILSEPHRTDLENAAVFRESAPNELLGLIENRGGKWNYAHVFENN